MGEGGWRSGHKEGEEQLQEETIHVVEHPTRTEINNYYSNQVFYRLF